MPEPTTPPPVTAERAKDILRWLAAGQRHALQVPGGFVAPEEQRAAATYALARLAVLDAARGALGIVAAEIRRVSAQYDGDPADAAGNVSNLEMTSRECRAILAAYDQLGGPTP